MLIIDSKIVSIEILSEKFVCDLNKCKGACCIEGDFGAPLEIEELGELDAITEKIKPYLTHEGIEEIEKNGGYIMNKSDKQFKTNLINKGPCVYINYENGIAHCGIERAWKDGVIEFRKPISCHLYPIRISKENSLEELNYERWDICKAACSFGKKLKVPVYQFLKEPLIRKYGAIFYKALDREYKKMKE